MFVKVHAVLKLNQALWVAFIAFVARFSDYETIINAISKKRKKQEADSTGYTKERDEKKTDMVNKALLVAGAIMAYASFISDRALFQSVKFNFTELFRADDITSRDRCQHIHETADSIIAQLADYGITNNTLTDLQSLIDNFSDFIEIRDAVEDVKEESTESLEKIFHSGDILLNEQFDNLMLQFKASQPDFYSQYIHARETDNLGETKFDAQPPVNPA